ncbi:MAG TPA: hypothetical protein VFT16_00450 [Candidatus Saccharimonadales bacterium]|nr:hypothetical protein [Candidatus Saccharimonadales bacterium]
MGASEVTGYLRRYNRAVRRGGEIPPVADGGLSVPEQHRVERFLWVADPHGRALQVRDAESRRRAELAALPPAEPETYGSVGAENAERLQAYLASLTQEAVAIETPTLEGEQ